eukprot:COSAG01_NODE_811_length_13417_cov_6.641012_2_plen_324_part_00
MRPRPTDTSSPTDTSRPTDTSPTDTSSPTDTNPTDTKRACPFLTQAPRVTSAATCWSHLSTSTTRASPTPSWRSAASGHSSVRSAPSGRGRSSPSPTPCAHADDTTHRAAAQSVSTGMHLCRSVRACPEIEGGHATMHAGPLPAQSRAPAQPAGLALLQLQLCALLLCGGGGQRWRRRHRRRGRPDQRLRLPALLARGVLRQRPLLPLRRDHAGAPRDGGGADQGGRAAADRRERPQDEHAAAAASGLPAAGAGGAAAASPARGTACAGLPVDGVRPPALPQSRDPVPHAPHAGRAVREARRCGCGEEKKRSCRSTRGTRWLD